MAEMKLPREKKVGHLTLLREARPITATEFNALSFRERLGMVRAASGKAKYNLILEARDAERLVRNLPVQEMYLFLKELGEEDVSDLLALATRDQITAFLDLDCWNGDSLSPGVARHWLKLLLEGGEEQVSRTVFQLDFELLVLLMKKFLTVVSGPEDIEDDDVRAEAFHRNGGYQIEFRDSEDAKVVGAALDILFWNDRPFYGGLLEAVRWESEAQLEEEVYRQRRGRLQDRGFADPFEALGVYAYLDPDTFDGASWQKTAVSSGEEGLEAPGFVLSLVSPEDLLGELLSRGVDSPTAWELTFLLNKVLAADRVAMGDAEEVRKELEEVYRYLNLGLEHLCAGAKERAAEVFDGVYLEAIFRIGFSLTLRLRRRAERLKKSRVGLYLDSTFRAPLEALCRRKPLFSEGMDDEARTGERHFATQGDLRRAAEWLEKVEILRHLFENAFPFELPAPEAVDLDGCLPGDVSDLALSTFFLTALGNRILDRGFAPQLIARSELPELHRRVCSEGQLRQGLREETRHWLNDLVEGAADFGDYCLNLWAEEFCPLDPDRIDPRFVGGLIIRG